MFYGNVDRKNREIYEYFVINTAGRYSSFDAY